MSNPSAVDELKPKFNKNISLQKPTTFYQVKRRERQYSYGILSLELKQIESRKSKKKLNLESSIINRLCCLKPTNSLSQIY